MGTESPSNQKTEQELFDEVSEALSSGKNIGTILNKTELVGEQVKPVEEEVVVETPVIEDTTTTATDTPEVPAVETPPVDEEDSWASELSDELKEKIKLLREEKKAAEEAKNQAEHRVKSELGRVPFLQRKVEELSRQLSEPRTPTQVPAATKTSLTGSKFAEKLAEARAVDPALADLLEAMRDDIVAPLREELTNEVNQTKALFADKEQEQLWQSEKTKLLQMIPEADAAFKHPLYKQWKNEIPENLHRLASSIYADEVSIALEQFSKWVGVHHPELVAPPQQQAAATTTTTTNSNDAVAKLAADRARKLNSTLPRTSAQSPKGGDGIPDNPEELFNYLTAKIAKGESYKV